MRITHHAIAPQQVTATNTKMRIYISSSMCHVGPTRLIMRISFGCLSLVHLPLTLILCRGAYNSIGKNGTQNRNQVYNCAVMSFQL